mgnify:CR=1 FL=1
MKKILIITDAWEPQVNGVVTTMTTVVQKLREKNFEVDVIHPGMFHTFPLPNYPEISVSWNFWELKKKIENSNADYMHISVEGPLGVTGRHYCLEHEIPYTTCIHTKFPEYVYERFGIGLDVTKGLLKWFHNPAAKTLVNTISHKKELEKDGFTDLVLWSRGFDEKIFYPFPEGGKQKYLLYVGMVAVEKNIVTKLLDSLGCPDPDFAAKLVSWSDIIRKTFYDGGVDEIIATRRLAHICKAYSIFGDRLQAIELCINRFDEETKTSFKDLYTKVDADVNDKPEEMKQEEPELTEDSDLTPF